jgi:hypothetical protein
VLGDARRAVVRLPFERRRPVDWLGFPPLERLPLPWLKGSRLALVATGGSGALASVVDAGRALEEAGVAPAVLSLCSGSALFGFPIAAGIPAEELAAFTNVLRPEEYIDVDWGGLVSLVPRSAWWVHRYREGRWPPSSWRVIIRRAALNQAGSPPHRSTPPPSLRSLPSLASTAHDVAHGAGALGR